MFLMSSKSRRFILSVLFSVGLSATAMPMQHGSPKLPQPKTTAAHQELDMLLEKFFNGEIDEVEIPKPDEYQAVNAQPVVNEDDDRNDEPVDQEVENQEPVDGNANTDVRIPEPEIEQPDAVRSTETANRSRNSISEQPGVSGQEPSEKMMELLDAIEKEESMEELEVAVAQQGAAVPTRSHSKAASSAKMQDLFDAIDYDQAVSSGQQHKLTKKRTRKMEENIDNGGSATSTPVTYTTVGKEAEFSVELDLLRAEIPPTFNVKTQKDALRSAIAFIDEMNGVETVLQEPDEREFEDAASFTNAVVKYLLQTLVSRLPGNVQLNKGFSKPLPGHLTRHRALFEARHYIAALKNARTRKYANKEYPSSQDKIGQPYRGMEALGLERPNPTVSQENAHDDRRGDNQASTPFPKRLRLKIHPNMPLPQQRMVITQQPFVQTSASNTLPPLVPPQNRAIMTQQPFVQTSAPIASASQQPIFPSISPFRTFSTPAAVSQGSDLFSSSNRDEIIEERKQKNNAIRKERVIQMSESYQWLANFLKIPHERKPEVILQHVIKYLNRSGYRARSVDDIDDVAELFTVLATQLPGNKVMQRAGGQTPLNAMSRLEALTRTIEFLKALSSGAGIPGATHQHSHLTAQSALSRPIQSGNYPLLPPIQSQPIAVNLGPLMLNPYAQSTAGLGGLSLMGPAYRLPNPATTMTAPVNVNQPPVLRQLAPRTAISRATPSQTPSQSLAAPLSIGPVTVPQTNSSTRTLSNIQEMTRSIEALANALPGPYPRQIRTLILKDAVHYIKGRTGQEKTIAKLPNETYPNKYAKEQAMFEHLCRELAASLPDNNLTPQNDAERLQVIKSAIEFIKNLD